MNGVVVNNWYLLVVTLVACTCGAYVLYIAMQNIDAQWRSKKRRRKAHLRHVNATIIDLRFKIINLTLACERGDLSLTAFNRRVLNAARLIRRYENKKAQLNRLVK